jgi:hypothetical protein
MVVVDDILRVADSVRLPKMERCVLCTPIVVYELNPSKLALSFTVQLRRVTDNSCTNPSSGEIPQESDLPVADVFLPAALLLDPNTAVQLWKHKKRIVQNISRRTLSRINQPRPQEQKRGQWRHGGQSAFKSKGISRARPPVSAPLLRGEICKSSLLTL